MWALTPNERRDRLASLRDSPRKENRPMAISRRGFIVSLAAAVPAIFISRVAHAEHYDAMLCGNCGFGSKNK